VYHAVYIHERLWGFEPCHVLPAKHRIEPKFEIHERWFPGCHYDIGRLRFQFFRSGGPAAEISDVLNSLSETVTPNHVFADLAQKWMLESIQEHSHHELISNIDARINTPVTNMESADIDTGTGDIYGNILHYAPLGPAREKWVVDLKKFVDDLKQFAESTGVSKYVISAVSNLQPIAEPSWKFVKFNFRVLDVITRKSHLNSLPFADSVLKAANEIFSNDLFSEDALTMVKVLGCMLSPQIIHHEFKTILNFLAQTKERRITDVNASVVRYDEEMLGNRNIMKAGRIYRKEGTYESQTYENFTAFQKIML
ncbi:hypothetical protein BG005_003665, partial [Podila minutissima]